MKQRTRHRRTRSCERTSGRKSRHLRRMIALLDRGDCYYDQRDFRVRVGEPDEYLA